MNTAVKKVIVVGGGSAGWLAAGILAADHYANAQGGLDVALIESPTVPAIGVGEGTWPTMRDTLRRIGLDETGFLKQCDASFKQGTRFDGWVTGAHDDRYFHPFTAPQGYGDVNMAAAWRALGTNVPFAEAACAQPHICLADKAPKQKSTPPYAAVLNYAYHLDAMKFAALLKEHCTRRLGVRHIVDDVIAVNAAENGDIRSITGERTGDHAGDLFIDCSGQRAVLLGGHFGVGCVDIGKILFNDRALAAQAISADMTAPVASQTISAARPGGWIWDIGLQSRRGVGYVYSSAHINENEAERTLRDYIAASTRSSRPEIANMRTIAFRSGYRKTFWRGNCVAVGMAAGFIEPLEASALVMVELSADMISRELPANRAIMAVTAERFNRRFTYRWERIIDFLKLHYILSRREDPYWADNRRPETTPDRLLDLLKLWRYQPPGREDFTETNEVFPAASYQYVLYGMGFETLPRPVAARAEAPALAGKCFDEVRAMTQKYLAGLPTNRDYLNHIGANGRAEALVQ